MVQIGKEGSQLNGTLLSRIKGMDILIGLYIFGSVVLDPGDYLLRLIKVLFVIPCLVYILRTRKLYFDTYVKWMLGFTLVSGLSFFWALSVSNASYRFQTLILNFICIYCLLVYLRNRLERIHLILKILLIAPIILEMRVVMSYGLLAFAEIRNIEGIMSSNAIGMRAGIAAVLGVYFFITKKKHRMMYSFSIGLNTAIMVLTASRKALLFMVIPLTLYYVFRQWNIKKILRNAIFSMILVGLTYHGMMNIPFVHDMVGYRMETLIYAFVGTGKTDGSTSLRLKMIEWGLEWFRLKPWLGYGLNNYMNLLGTMKTYAGTTGVYAHNNYIELLVDLGIIGTSIYYFIYLKILVKAFKARKGLTPLTLMLVCIFVSIIINEYGMVSYIDIYAQIILVLTWFLLLSSTRAKAEVRNLTC